MMTTLSPSPREKLETQRASLPSDTLLYIFDLAVGGFDLKKELAPSLDVGNDSSWSKELRTKKSLVRVCKSWRILATPYLYHRIYLHRVGQLCALVKVLKDNSGGEGAGYCSWVHHIHGRFFVPTSWETVYYKNIIRLLTLCTSTRSFSWAIQWGSPSSWQGGSGYPMSAQYSTINLIRLGLSQPSLLPLFSSLQKLTFTLDASFQQNIPHADVKTKLAFYNLEDLTCEVTESEFLEGLAVVSRSFVMPKLQSLAFKSSTWTWGYLTDLQITAIFGLLESHGEKLSALFLDLPILSKIQKGVYDILLRTPNLRTLRCAITAFRPIDTKTTTATPVFNLENLELFVSKNNISYISFHGLHRNIFQQYLAMASSREIFPSLRTIVVLNQSNPILPMDTVLAPSCHKRVYQYLFAWTKKYREMGISLVGVDDEPIAPENPDPGRWTGRNGTDEDEGDEEEDRHTDPEDLSFDSDEVSYREESSEYSASDSDSDDGIWDSEPSGSEVGSVEALEIFENTVQVRSFTRLNES